MADYAGRIVAANFEGRVASIRSGLSNWSNEYTKTVDAEDDGVIARLDLVLDHVLVVTASAVAELVPMRWVTDLVADLDSAGTAVGVLGELDAVTVPAAQALTNAVEEIAVELAQWSFAAVGDYREAVTQAASTYRRSAGQQLAGLQAEIDAAGTRLTEIREGSERLSTGMRDQSALALTELDSRFNEIRVQLAALEVQRTAIAEQVARSAERADQAIATYQQQFSSAQETRSTEFQGTLAELTDKSEEARLVAAKQTQTGLAEIQEKVDEAGELVSVFAAAGTANAYSGEARQQAKSANTWRIVAIVLAVVAAAAAATLLVAAGNSATNWSVVIGKAAVGVAFGGLASYAAKQSSRHRAREETARHLELNIVAFGPFIRDLDPEKQEEARLKVVESIFLREIGRGSTKEESNISDEQINLLGKVLELFKHT